ncbi:MAG: SurA N-terminal domain-containing protein, partial [Victivallales bacterium]|nr:SurA N-terminal domain-containing protein [Victivallales bacterium]
MFISHFNRYFEKHAKITYFVLLLIIIATFVIFVTPGDVMGGPGRITDFGKMYGKTLTVEKMEKEMNRALISIWLDYPQYFGSDVFRDKRELFSYTLTRMRLLHAAKDMKLNKVEDQAVIDMIRGCSAFQSEGKFDNTAYKNFLDYCKNTMGIYPADFDEIAAECISVRRVQEQVRGAVSVTDSDIESALALYTL